MVRLLKEDKEIIIVSVLYVVLGTTIIYGILVLDYVVAIISIVSIVTIVSVVMQIIELIEISEHMVHDFNQVMCIFDLIPDWLIISERALTLVFLLKVSQNVIIEGKDGCSLPNHEDALIVVVISSRVLLLNVFDAVVFILDGTYVDGEDCNGVFIYVTNLNISYQIVDWDIDDENDIGTGMVVVVVCFSGVENVYGKHVKGTELVFMWEVVSPIIDRGIRGEIVRALLTHRFEIFLDKAVATIDVWTVY